MNTANSLSDKRVAIVRSAFFWAGFFAFFFLTRIGVGMTGERGGLDQWYGAAIMTVLMITWTRICLRLDGQFDYPSVRFSRGSLPRTLLGLIFAALLCSVSLVSLAWLVPGVGFGFKGADIGHALAYAVLLLLLASYEEIGFRGYPLARMLPSFGIWTTLFLIAPVFALYHVGMGWALVQALVGTGIGSLLFGMAAIAGKRGLALPIGVHTGWNFTTWCLTSGSGPWKMTFPSYLSHRVQTVGMIMYVICMLFGTALLWFWAKDRGALSIT
jgi:membrane protease YdiL (CAAX protease family)